MSAGTHSLEASEVVPGTTKNEFLKLSGIKLRCWLSGWLWRWFKRSWGALRCVLRLLYFIGDLRHRVREDLDVPRGNRQVVVAPT